MMNTLILTPRTTYEEVTPADLVLLCGVFGNISTQDIARTIEHLPVLCAPRATIIWTRHRHPPDLTSYIRDTFERAGFNELAFADSPPFGIGVNVMSASPQPFQRDISLFEFIGYDLLRSELRAETSLPT
jgi:hypothetical protein